MAKHYGPKVEKELRKQREMLREVLRHLEKTSEPHNYDGLYVLFDLHRTGDIAPVLREMIERRLITKDEKNDVAITDAGRKLLNDPDYWK